MWRLQFHQCVRALTPLATIVLSVMFLNKRPSRETYLSLLPVVFGVVFATFGEYNYTMRGLILTLLGMVLAAIKTIVTNRVRLSSDAAVRCAAADPLCAQVQVGRLKLHPLDLLIRMSPLAFMQCVLWGWYSGELDRVRVYGATEMTQSKAIALLMNGIIAFGLNVVSFTANKKTSALTMTVAGASDFPWSRRPQADPAPSQPTSSKCSRSCSRSSSSTSTSTRPTCSASRSPWAAARGTPRSSSRRRAASRRR